MSSSGEQAKADEFWAAPWSPPDPPSLKRAKELLGQVSDRKAGDISEPMQELWILAEAYPDDEEIVDQYAMAYIHVANNQPTPQALAAATATRQLAARRPTSWRLNSSHAVVLTALTLRAIDFNPLPFVQELADLAERFGHDDFFDYRLAASVNKALSRQQIDLNWALDILRAAAYRHPENPKIVEPFMGAMIDRGVVDPNLLHRFVPEMEQFLARFPYLPEARNSLTKALYNETVHHIPNQPPPWERLRALAQQYPEDLELTRYYALGVANTGSDLPVDGRQWAVNLLVGLVQAHPDDRTIGWAYALALSNLSLQQTSPAREATIQQIRYVVEHFPNDEGIALRLAKALMNYGKAQLFFQRAATQQELRALANRFPQNSGIAEAANGLANSR